MVADVNQSLPCNIIEVQEMVEEMTSAIIRTPSGRQIVVEWDARKPENVTKEVIRQVFDKDKKVTSTYLNKDTEVDNEHKAVDGSNAEQEKQSEANTTSTLAPSSTTTSTGTSTTNTTTSSSTSSANTTNPSGTNATTTTKPNGTTTKPGSTSTSPTGSTMNIKTNPNEVVLKTKYFLSTKNALYLQTYVGGKIQKNGVWVNASQAEIKQYFLPNEENINKYKYQFLSLAATAGISEEDAASFLKGKGILSGKAKNFLAAAKNNNINEIYLMAHACLETGNGTSKLATGVCYNGTVVYNMFGIGAYDSDPINSGARYAYNAGWTTPESAIAGGAKFISENYINHATYKQDTLYEMRWNPGSPGSHQYATDVAWATKQAIWIEKIYAKFENPKVTFDIPVYMAD